MSAIAVVGNVRSLHWSGRSYIVLREEFVVR